MSLKISVLKVILAILNTSLALLGISLLSLSVFELNTSTPGTAEYIANVVQIFIGSFVILSSFFGCFGTCRVSVSLMWTYITCVLILLAFQLYIIIVAHSTDYVQNASQGFNRLWQNQSLNAAAIADLEQKYFCCGRNGARDYSASGKVIPVSCYQSAVKSSDHLFTRGCLETLQKNGERNGVIGLTIKWILFCVESLSLAVATLLAISVRNKYRREQF